MRRLAASVSAFVLSTAWAQNAFAWSFWDCIPTSSEPQPVPEIDAGAGFAALALVASVAAVIYRKVAQEDAAGGH